MNKFAWWKVLFGVALVLLPGSMLLLPVVLVFIGRQRRQPVSGEDAPESPTCASAPPDLAQIVPEDVPSVRLASA